MKLKAGLFFTAMVILFISLFYACKNRPNDPVYDNPFDLENSSTGGDPFELTAQIANGGITLTWNIPVFEDLHSFKIYRSEQASSDYSVLETVGNTQTNYTDETVENGHSYWFVITAVSTAGEETARSNSVPVNIKTEPFLTINGEDAYTADREVSLTILAATATQMMLSNSSDFSGSQWENYATVKNWTLSESEGQKNVYLKVKYENDNESEAVSGRITLDVTPPAIALTIYPDSGITGETIFSFDPTASTDNFASLSFLQFRFDWENDGVYDHDWLPLMVHHHIYETGGGDRTIKMELKDGAGWTVDSIFTIFVNTYPNASFMAEQIGFDRIVHFDASASSDYEDGDNISFRWDFDGNDAWDTGWLTTDTINYEYEDFGEYNARLEVKDQNTLTAVAVREITVAAQEPLLDMVLLEGGTFTMGDTWGDGSSNELPTHQVNLSGFYMGKFELTNTEVVEILNWALGQGKINASSITVRNSDGDQQELLDLDDSDCQISFNGSELATDPGKENFPCLEITWYGAVALGNYLSEWEGLTACYNLTDWSCNWGVSGYRLPTEAEWEYAARGGAQSLGYKYSGSNSAADVAWYDTNSNNDSHEVGTKQPNELGLYDLSGNVWEWCWDWYGSYSSSSQTNPTGPENGSSRILRGGAWNGTSDYVRVANRSNSSSSTSNDDVGLRLVRNL